MKFKEHQIVRTTHPIGNIPAGAKGVIVDVYGDGTAYEVEFHCPILVTVSANLIEEISNGLRS